MNVIICGAGEVGSHTTEVLAEHSARTVIVDLDRDRLAAVADAFDVRTLIGNAADGRILHEAGAARADLVVAATDRDEVNLLAASIAKGLGARRSIARVHEQTYFNRDVFDFEDHFGIDRLICPDDATALAIARAMRNPAAIELEHFSRGNIELQRFPVSDDSQAIGHRLSTLDLPHGARVAAIHRGDQIFLPTATATIERGDLIVLIANQATFDRARKMFRKADAKRRRVVISGGTPMAAWLCQALSDTNWSIRLFETDRARAEQLAAELPRVTVINADPTTKDVFDEERLSMADYFVALSDDEEANIVSCVLARSRGVSEVIAVVHRPNYLDLLYLIGIDQVVSPRVMAVKEIERVIDERPLRRVATLAEGFVDVFQVRVGAGAPVAGVPLRDLKPGHWIIAAMSSRDGVAVPGADDALQVDDEALVIGAPGVESSLRTAFAAERG